MKHKDNFKSFVLEFIIFILIIASTYIYQDPTINIIPYPFNFIIFLILLSIPLYFILKKNIWSRVKMIRFPVDFF